ncbi:MAG TPA: HAD family hydrolase [Polyangia bacterium]|nr:HAD family hydrolase [Polyangia bacterium]HWE30747.1 HAD family hydrolase [Polyangia bacterium]
MTRPAAFFDMDHTLLQCNTASLWLRWLREHKEISLYRTLRAIGWLMQYKLSVLDMESVTERAIAEMAGQSEDELVAKTRVFFTAQVLTAVAPKAVAAVQRHRDEGHVMAILSSSTPYMVEPLAAHLGIEHAICTRLNVSDGKFAGTHVRPACYGEGKVHWAEEFASANGVDLGRSYFYTDSYSDLPMLQRVGMARVVNPDARLKRHARRVGWDVDLW